MDNKRATILYEKKTYSIEKNDDPEFFTHLISATMVMHTHTYWEGFYVVRGACSHRTKNSGHTLLPGKLYLLKPYTEHSFADKDSRELFLHRDFCIGDDLLKECCNSISPNLYNDMILSNQNIFSFNINQSEMDYLELRLNNYSITKECPDRHSLAKFFVHTILSLFVEQHSSPANNYDDAFKKILVLLKDKEVLYGGLPELSKRTGYSHGHLCRIFKENTHQTPLKILTDYRMQQAEALLTQTDYSIAFIANEVGYPSLSRFILLFKRYYNDTPYQYRKNRFHPD